MIMTMKEGKVMWFHVVSPRVYTLCNFIKHGTKGKSVVNLEYAAEIVRLT